jgi:hypothetical protein
VLLLDGRNCGSSSQLSVKLPNSPQWAEVYGGKADEVTGGVTVVDWVADDVTVSNAYVDLGILKSGSEGRPV